VHRTGISVLKRIRTFYNLRVLRDLGGEESGPKEESMRQPHPCSFCKIMSGEIRCYPVFEDEASFAFLDHRPLFPGHCLLVPREHCETLVDLPDTLLTPLFINARLLAQAVETGLRADGTFVAVNNRVSQSVPHLHIHIVPRRWKDGLKGFFWPRRPYGGEEAIVKTQQAIREALAGLQASRRNS
jgi:histidine triad (HIT) family protein